MPTIHAAFLHGIIRQYCVIACKAHDTHPRGLRIASCVAGMLRSAIRISNI
jgi:hypothetical protein